MPNRYPRPHLPAPRPPVVDADEKRGGTFRAAPVAATRVRTIQGMGFGNKTCLCGGGSSVVCPRDVPIILAVSPWSRSFTGAWCSCRVFNSPHNCRSPKSWI